ncbi:MAG: 30S ribosomal protein S6 [Oscillospiraceae bacterium]|nr:30S ribosomal protein S6 [Oscillospiraceae bacterium]
MAKLSEQYETIAVFSVKEGDEVAQQLSEKFKALIEKNATVDKVEEWGKRKLAYDINYQSEGYYLLVEFTCTPDFPAELERVYGITDGVLRSMIVKKGE